MKICLQKIYNSTVLLQRVKEKERGTKTNGEERVEVRKLQREKKREWEKECTCTCIGFILLYNNH